MPITEEEEEDAANMASHQKGKDSKVTEPKGKWQPIKRKKKNY